MEKCGGKRNKLEMVDSFLCVCVCVFQLACLTLQLPLDTHTHTHTHTHSTIHTLEMMSSAFSISRVFWGGKTLVEWGSCPPYCLRLNPLRKVFPVSNCVCVFFSDQGKAAWGSPLCWTPCSNPKWAVSRCSRIRKRGSPRPSRSSPSVTVGQCSSPVACRQNMNNIVNACHE